MRHDACKALFPENRGRAFEGWREPFNDLRVPLLCNLRRNRFEQAQHNSNTCSDWFPDRVFVLAPMQRLAAKLRLTMQECPPSRSPGSFDAATVQKQIEAGIVGKQVSTSAAVPRGVEGCAGTAHADRAGTE